jgi:D-xylose transport system substrate-binding protein
MSNWKLNSKAALLSAAALVGLLNIGVSNAATLKATPANAAKIVSTMKNIKIGVSFGDLNLERWPHDEADIISYLKQKVPNAQVLVQGANGDSSTQVSQCENLISQGVKVLIINAQDGSALTQVVNDAHRAGVKVIAYDRMITNAPTDLYVSYNNVEVGKLQAKYLVSLKPKGDYVLIEGSPTDPNAYQFYQGQMDVLQPYIKKGDIKVVFKQFTPNWSTTNALNEMENALTKTGNKITAVLDANDSTALGVIQALQQQKLAGKIPVTGQDADLANCQDIVEGLQSMTVYKDIKWEADTAAQAALDYIAGAKIPTNIVQSNDYGKWKVPSILGQPVAVTKKNMYSVIIKNGFHTEAHVYANLPKTKWPK